MSGTQATLLAWGVGRASERARGIKDLAAAEVPEA
jgi:hypothetical protein